MVVESAALQAANDSCAARPPSRESGFGARSVFHTAHLLRLSEDLPIEIVDSEEHVERLLPILDEMVGEGPVTLEKVRVVKYAPGKRPIGIGVPEKAK